MENVGFLELFTNDGYVQLRTGAKQFRLPKSIKEIMVFNNNNEMVKASQTIIGSIDIGSMVTVGDVLGTIKQFDGDWITLILPGEEGVKKIKLGPGSQIEAESDYNLFEINNGSGPYKVTGFIPSISWEPIYQLTLLANENQIKFALSAALVGENLVELNNLGIKKVYFNTRSLMVREGKYQERAMMVADMPAEQGPVEKSSMRWEADLDRLSNNVIYPLENYGTMNSDKVWFYEISPNRLYANYGYIITTQQRLPNGKVIARNYKDELVGITRLDIHGQEIWIKVQQSQNFFFVTNVDTYQEEIQTENKKQRVEKVSIRIEIQNNSREIRLTFLIWEYIGQVQSSTYPVNRVLGNKLVWNVQINPGSSLFETELLINL